METKLKTLTLDKFDKFVKPVLHKKDSRHCNKCQTTETQKRKSGAYSWHRDPLSTSKWLCHSCYLEENFGLYARLRKNLRNLGPNPVITASEWLHSPTIEAEFKQHNQYKKRNKNKKKRSKILTGDSRKRKLQHYYRERGLYTYSLEED